ncbi:unnamed protein product [marine sediment metagenome]|uniref:Uncharacterized protein n=1 Tax=marine sediment metagenome TaxID=412755 RepID=X1FAK6_9ZZZZ
MTRSELLSGTWIIASFLALINVIIALTIHIATSTNFDFFTAANLMIPEFGVMLIIGACLMGRQPLEDEKRYDEDGNPTKSWKYAIIGKKILLSSVFLLAFTGLFFILGLVFPP